VPRGTEPDRFTAALTPHLPAAFTLARWLLGSTPDAEDAVQEAALRAFRARDAQSGDNFRAWWLRIVRNVCHTALASRAARGNVVPLDTLAEAGPPDPAASPYEVLAARRDRARLAEALRALPEIYREILVLREIEGLSYRELAQVLAISEGTVMSRLSRGRARLAAQLTAQLAPQLAPQLAEPLGTEGRKR
jgi:RNA polymerase sigma-70 factor (ECF subfamily)